MKALFLTGNRTDCEAVYPERIRRELAASLELLEPVYDVDSLERHADILRQADVIFSTWGMPRLTSDEIRRYFGGLKAVFYAAGSVQYFAKPFLEAGVEVYSAWAANAIPVAEFTVAQIILANKGYFSRFHRSGSSDWSNRSSGAPFTGNYDAQVGLIGVGMIGSLVAQMLRSYRISVLVYDPFLSSERAAELGVEQVSLEELFSRCGVISNHLANNPQTVGILNGELFRLMKPNAVFINTGRGAQVVEDDLISALEAEPSRVALLDVTMPEPPCPDSRLYQLDNVLLSPHIAGSLGNEVARMGEYMCEEYKRWAAGLPTRWGVTPKLLETMA